MAQTLGSSVARASVKLATVARMSVPLQMLTCAAVAPAAQEAYPKAWGSLLAWFRLSLPCGPRRSATTSWPVTCSGCFIKELLATKQSMFRVQCGGPAPQSPGLHLASAAPARWRRLEPSTSRPPFLRPLLVLLATQLIAKTTNMTSIPRLSDVRRDVHKALRSHPLRRFQLIPPMLLQRDTGACWAV